MSGGRHRNPSWTLSDCNWHAGWICRDCGMCTDNPLRRTAKCLLRDCAVYSWRSMCGPKSVGWSRGKACTVKNAVCQRHRQHFMRPYGAPIDHRLTGTFGCRWRATHSHGRQRAIACLWSEAGALRACRLPIQQDAMTGTGLQATKRRVSGEDCSAAACNLPSAIRLFFRQPRGVRSSVRDVATRCSLSGQSGSHRAASSSRRGGVGVLVHFWIFQPQ